MTFEQNSSYWLESLFLPRGGNFAKTNKQTNKQTTMKNKILALLATIGLASSVTAVEINENLSINGFIDASYVNSDFSDHDTPASNNDISNSAVDEVELNFLVNAGNVSGELHVDSRDGTAERDT